MPIKYKLAVLFNLKTLQAREFAFVNFRMTGGSIFVRT